MSYPKDLDEYDETTLEMELERRRLLRHTILCVAVFIPAVVAK